MKHKQDRPENEFIWRVVADLKEPTLAMVISLEFVVRRHQSAPGANAESWRSRI